MHEILSAGNTSVTVRSTGHFDLACGPLTLHDCRPVIRLNHAEIAPPNWQMQAGRDEITLAGGNLIGLWKLRFRKITTPRGTPGIGIRMDARLHAPCDHLEFAPLSVPEIPLSHFFGMGAKMGGAVSIQLPQPGSRNFEAAHLAVLSRGNAHLFCSLPLRQPHPARITGRAVDGAVHDFAWRFNCDHLDWTEVDSGEIRFLATAQPYAEMTRWSDENTAGHKDLATLPPCGWNSWDYYRWTITEEEVLRNAEFIARDPVLSKHIKRIIVDDGWQYCYGEWDANPLFPNGMAYLARELTRMDFEPGLWFAPTIVEPHARIAQLDGDMLGLSEGGQPCLAYECMRRVGFVLDPTVPKSRQFLHETFDRYAAIGYRYFKLDFMAATLKAAQFHDRSVPRADIPRLIVQTVREAVAGRAEILGCNYLFCGGDEFVDSVRVGGDIHALWDCIRHNVVSVAGMAHTNRRLFINDPDFALARCEETSDDPDLKRLKPCMVFTPADAAYQAGADMVLAGGTTMEMQVLLSILVVNGGAINCSDNLPKLNGCGLELIRRTVAATPGEAGIPLDLFRREHAAEWLQKCGDTWRVLLINWEDRPASRYFDPAAHGINVSGATDFWNDTPLELDAGVLRRELAPHSCCFAVLR